MCSLSSITEISFRLFLNNLGRLLCLFKWSMFALLLGVHLIFPKGNWIILKLNAWFMHSNILASKLAIEEGTKNKTFPPSVIVFWELKMWILITDILCRNRLNWLYLTGVSICKAIWEVNVYQIKFVLIKLSRGHKHIEMPMMILQITYTRRCKQWVILAKFILETSSQVIT